jgi:hypothetical protein
MVRWTAKHDHIVALHIAGLEPRRIAEAVGLSLGQVKRILRDPRAQRASMVVRKRILGNVMKTVQERMESLGVTAIENIAETIDGEFEAGTKAKRHQDMVSFELLSRIGFGRKEPDKEGGGIKLTPEGEKRLIEAIAKADRAREIVIEAEEVEVE